MADHEVDERILLKWILKEIGQYEDWTDLFRDRPGELNITLHPEPKGHIPDERNPRRHLCQIVYTCVKDHLLSSGKHSIRY